MKIRFTIHSYTHVHLSSLSNELLYVMGLYYHNQYPKIPRRTIPLIYKLAKRYYEQAIIKGNIDAFIDLADYYFLIEKNESKGIECLSMGIKKKSIRCIRFLIKFYMKKQNYKMAKKYYIKAIKMFNDADSMHGLGIIYHTINKKYELAEKYYLKAIKYGNENALYNLGLCYFEQKNYIMMQKYFLLAVRHGLPQAMEGLAMYYQDIEINYENIKKYNLMAIEHNYVNSMYNLGYFYHKIEPNEDLMVKYYNMAINYNCAKSSGNLAFYYYVEKKDLKLAYKYLLVSTKLGHPDAKNILDSVRLQLQSELNKN